MKPKTWPLLLPLLTFLLLLNRSLSINQHYVDCKPFECGSLSISYPFFVPPTQPSFCGFEGFNVSCNPDNQIIINLSGDDYIINNISYNDLSINITNLAFSGPVFGCLNSVHNLTLGEDSKFNFTPNHKQLLLLQNCSSSKINTGNSSNYAEMQCKEDYKDNDIQHLLAVYEEDFRQEEVGNCSQTVEVTYEGEKTSVNGIKGLLRKGAILDYSTGNNCSRCQHSGGRCWFNQKTSMFLCACPDRDQTGHCQQSNRHSVLKIILGTVIPGSVITLALLFVYWRRGKNKSGSSFLLSRNEFIRENKNFETVLGNYEHLTPKRYTHSNIKKMTNSFKEKLGEGGFGGVYKGKLLDGRLVAVKLLKNSKGQGQGFINEVASIGRTNHVNIVTLLGFCYERNKRALVYEYMANGSLEKFMHGRANNEQSLPFETLFQIVLGIARGLEYLHRGCKTRILHFDIKPHNILLDEEFCPKISDFGLAKLTPQDKQSKVSMSGLRGTIGYIAPEVFCRTFGDVSHKSDVYSYGMMVLEVIGSRRRGNSQVENSSELYFPQYVYKQLEHGEEIETDITMDENVKQLKRKMIAVSLWCILPIPSNRPSMSTVLQMLEGSPESIDIPPMPTCSSPPRLEWDPSTSSTTTT